MNGLFPLVHQLLHDRRKYFRQVLRAGSIAGRKFEGRDANGIFPGDGIATQEIHRLQRCQQLMERCLGQLVAQLKLGEAKRIRTVGHVQQ